jgi:hypothetical protein
MSGSGRLRGVRVLVVDAADEARRAPSRVQAARRVEKKPAAAQLVAPANEHARLMAPLVCGPARS